VRTNTSLEYVYAQFVVNAYRFGDALLCGWLDCSLYRPHVDMVDGFTNLADACVSPSSSQSVTSTYRDLSLALSQSPTARKPQRALARNWKQVTLRTPMRVNCGCYVLFRGIVFLCRNEQHGS
jgi:hypothetical protein